MAFVRVFKKNFFNHFGSNIRMYVLLIAFFLVSSLFPSSTIDNYLVDDCEYKSLIQQGPITYQEIGNHYLNSFDNSDEIQTIYEKDELNLQKPVLSHQEKLRYVFNLFDQKNHLINNPYIDHATRILLKDLDVYYNPEHNLLSKLGNAHTVFGEAVRAYIISQPLTDIAILEKRQAFIKEIFENQELYDELTEQLTILKSIESGFFSFWRKENYLVSECIKKLYWNILPDHYNKSVGMLELGVRLNNAMTLSMFALVPSIIIARHKSISEGIKKILIAPNSPSKITLLAGILGLTTLYSGFLTYRYKMQWEIAQQAKNSILYMQMRLMDVASVVRICKHMSSLSKKHPKMRNALHGISLFDELFSINQQDDFKKLIELLQTDTFKGDASFFSWSGRILVAYKLMNEHKQKFASVLEILGEIDAYLSIAQHLKKLQDYPVSYTFAKYIRSHQPFIKLNNFWNIYIDPNNMVANSLQMEQKNRNIILTGSNTAGKSTILKGLLMSLLLAQTFGIVPAEYAEVTPFWYLGSCFRVADNVISGDSLFQAEVNRAKLLIDTIECVPASHFGFVVIDELFTGASCDIGQEIAYDITKKITKEYSKILSIFATHFKKLTQLEDELNGMSSNYKIDAHIDSQGNIVRPFKLEKGISSSNLALEIATNSIG